MIFFEKDSRKVRKSEFILWFGFDFSFISSDVSIISTNFKRGVSFSHQNQLNKLRISSNSSHFERMPTGTFNSATKIRINRQNFNKFQKILIGEISSAIFNLTIEILKNVIDFAKFWGFRDEF